MKYYITKERFEELKVELQKLKTESRSEITERLKRAKEYGDLSENFEYITAREEQAKLESRIAELEDTVKNAIIIKKSKSKENVSIGSTIEVKKEKGGKVFTYTIVGSTEADPLKNLISNESPFGNALLGKKVGDNVEFETPKGKLKYQIIKID